MKEAPGFWRTFLKMATITLMAVNCYGWILTFPGIGKGLDWGRTVMVPYRMGSLLDTICFLLSFGIVLFRRQVPLLCGTGIGLTLLAICVRLGIFRNDFQPGYWFEPWLRGALFVMMFCLLHLTWEVRWRRRSRP